MKTFKRRSGKRVDPGQKVAAARSRVDRASLRLRSAIAEALDCVSPTVSAEAGQPSRMMRPRLAGRQNIKAKSDLSQKTRAKRREVQHRLGGIAGGALGGPGVPGHCERDV